MRVRIVEDTISVNEVFQKLLSVRVQKEKLTNGYAGKLRVSIVTCGTRRVSTFCEMPGSDLGLLNVHIQIPS